MAHDCILVGKERKFLRLDLKLFGCLNIMSYTCMDWVDIESMALPKTSIHVLLL